MTLVTVAVGASVAHTLQIEGAMEPISKIILSVVAMAGVVAALLFRRPWRMQA